MATPMATTGGISTGMRCSSCLADFEQAGDYRSHCRSEWHNFNLKRSLVGLNPIGSYRISYRFWMASGSNWTQMRLGKDINVALVPKISC